MVTFFTAVTSYTAVFQVRVRVTSTRGNSQALFV